MRLARYDYKIKAIKAIKKLKSKNYSVATTYLFLYGFVCMDINNIRFSVFNIDYLYQTYTIQMHIFYFNTILYGRTVPT